MSGCVSGSVPKAEPTMDVATCVPAPPHTTTQRAGGAAEAEQPAHAAAEERAVHAPWEPASSMASCPMTYMTTLRAAVLRYTPLLVLDPDWYSF